MRKEIDHREERIGFFGEVLPARNQRYYSILYILFSFFVLFRIVLFLHNNIVLPRI